jgi:predicted ATP-binding protein involved in virulence
MINHLKKDTVLLIDGIEYYLNPKWQDRLAKLLVPLVKELDISICIFSNNDYFKNQLKNIP